MHHKTPELYEAYLREEEQGRFVGLRSTELQCMALSVIGDYEDKIRILRKRIQGVKSVYNRGSLINDVLPNEIMVQVFLWAGPRTSTADAIRLTHVCRSWRSLIYGTPAFWVDLLYCCGRVLGRDARDFELVRTAFLKSALVPRLRFSLKGAFLRCLRTLWAPAARISTLSLDCTEREDWHIRGLFGLHMPDLENLTVWLKCSEIHLPNQYSSLHFPRLRRLRTNCVTIVSHLLISPTVRQLIIGQQWEEWGRKASQKLVPCCALRRRLDRLWNVLRAQSPKLTELRLDNCIADDIVRPGGPRLDLSSLETLLLSAHKASTIRTVLDAMKLPSTAQVTLASGCRNHELCSMGKDVPCIPKVDHLVIDMGCVRYPAYRYVVRGYEGPTKHLMLCSDLPPSAVYNPFDLLRFFEGPASMFSPATITTLDVTCTEPLPSDNAGWLWLFRHFPGILHLNVNTPSSHDLCTALAHDEVLPNLRRFHLRTDTDDTAVSNEILVFVLEDRASRGLLLDSLYFSRRAYFEEEAVIPPDVASNLRKRLSAIVPHFSFYVPWGPRCGSGAEEVISL